MTPHSAVVESPTLERRSRDGRGFYVFVGLVTLAVTLLSFAPSLVAPSNRAVPLPLTPLVLVHTAVSSAWLLLFLIQTLLVAARRTVVHRRLGIIGGILAGAFVVVGSLASIEEARRGYDLSGDLVPRGTTSPPGDVLAPINAFVLFALLVGAALWYRRRPEIHKRLMVLAMVGPMLGAPIAHFVGHWPLLHPVAAPFTLASTTAFLSLNAVHDRVTRGGVHPVSLWGGIGVFAWFTVFFGAVAPSPGWQAFAHWLVR